MYSSVGLSLTVRSPVRALSQHLFVWLPPTTVGIRATLHVLNLADNSPSLNAPSADSYNDLMQRKTGGGAPAQSTLQRVNDELLDVQRIMGKNIEQVLDRGETLDGEPCTPIRGFFVNSHRLLSLTSHPLIHSGPFGVSRVRRALFWDVSCLCMWCGHVLAPASPVYLHSSL